jgi:hypothetical protein
MKSMTNANTTPKIELFLTGEGADLDYFMMLRPLPHSRPRVACARRIPSGEP